MSKTKTKSPAETKEFLASIGLNPNAPALDALPTRVEPVKPAKAKVQLAPEGTDPRTMPVADIVFDERLLDDFPSLEGAGMAAASRYVFELYKSPAKNKDRHRRLHDEIGLFIQRVRRNRETGTAHTKDQVKQTRKQRDLLALLKQHGIESVDDLKQALGGED